ncbi:hypothetical protein GCM10010399_66310 [Dactylosporangium fulvum]|uniref:Uncharacterized protein n=1 Tax=Dactylosporangium fulvum TaxID=53359 RepID=A0ABY5VVM8_9ACTN|nr:hypothetical protein [Dactylosporangium fulvum]UWP81655.1 hypothetical protein Dfulv_42165 [Dactylosporangium fulvum]
MTQPPDESPTLRQPAEPGSPTWVGSASVPPGGSRRRRQWEDTLDLPVEPQTLQQPAAPPQPEIRYIPVPVPSHPHAGYGPLPHGYRPPPPGYAPPPPVYRRRRRKWPWVLLFLFALCAGCCGGSYAWARPYWVQYPASVDTAATVPGLTRTDDAAAKKTAEQLRTSLTSDHLDESGFTVTYQDAANRQQRVIVFGATRFITDPARDLDASIRKLGTKIQISDVRKVDPGVFGGEQRCAASRMDGRSAAVCGWSDHGVIAIAVFTGKSVDQAAATTRNLRGSIVRRD